MGMLEVARDFLGNLFSFDQAHPLLFTQFYFWAFFALVLAMLCVFRNKILLRNACLFAVSLFFYYKTSGLFLLLLLFVVAFNYLAGLLIPRIRGKGWRKAVLAAGIVVDLSLLFYYKYAYFVTDVANNLFGTSFVVRDWFAAAGNRITGTSAFTVDSIFLPVGISFFIFQAISYIVDVSRGAGENPDGRGIAPVRNFMDFGFYLSFFPQLVAGPIVRAKEFIPQLRKPFFLSRHQFGIAIFWIINGLAKKLVLSDYLAVNFCDRVFENPLLYTGFENLTALFCYSLQVYADFSGYTDIAIGVAMLMGFYLPKNFNSPYKARSAGEFWKRWHITLGTWFRDYIFYPLSFSGPLKKVALRGRKRFGSHYGVIPATAVALFSVWLCNGLWHGAGWNYIFFGMYHFALILMGNLIKPPVLWLTGRFHIDRTSAPYRGMQIVRTAVLVCIGELFFRANGLRAGLAMVRSVIHSFSFATLRDQSFFSFGADQKDYLIVLITLLMILIVSILHERGVSIRKWAAGKSWMVRFGLLYFLILYIVVFGAYGDGYVPVDPIYAGF